MTKQSVRPETMHQRKKGTHLFSLLFSLPSVAGVGVGVLFPPPATVVCIAEPEA
jgi:hypothetical protein